MHASGEASTQVEERRPSRMVKIYIDRAEKTSSTPTTGLTLYSLGAVPENYVLFREVQGHRDDELVPKTESPIHLTEWEHFYSAQAKLNPGSAA